VEVVFINCFPDVQRFSTFTYETVRRVEERAFSAALENTALTRMLVPALAVAADLALAAL
jgi:hypothetical protein